MMADQYANTSSTSTSQTGLSPGLGLSSSTAFAALYVTDTSTASSVDLMSASAAGTSASSSDSADSQLLLLDQTWGDISTTSFDHSDDSLYHDDSHEVASANDLALAAVLNDDDNQWNTL
jgi:hypothetical protein